jgi:hypothetical protein
MGRRKEFGFSFSARRAIGISAFKQKVARATGIPTTRGGRRQKVGRALGCLVLLVVTAAISASAIAASSLLQR